VFVVINSPLPIPKKTSAPPTRLGAWLQNEGCGTHPRLPSVRVGEQSEWMKLIPLLLLIGMFVISGWAEGYYPEPYSSELVKKAEEGDAMA